MQLLLLASPRFFEIALGFFGSYLTFSREHTLSSLSTIFILFYTTLVAIAGIVGLIGLGTSNYSFSRIEHILEDLVRAGVAVHTALLLHPACSTTLPIRHSLLPRILYFLILLIVAACAIGIISFSTTYTARIISAALFIFASCFTMALLLFVVSSCQRFQPYRRYTIAWAFLAMMQLLAITASTLDLFSTNDTLHCVLEFCLVVWITGTLGAISGLRFIPPKYRLPAAEPHGTRRIPHLSVSEDFQACPDPFAGPLEMGQLPIVISPSLSPVVPRSMAISTWYSKSSRQRNSRLRRSRSSASNSSCDPFQFDRTESSIGRTALDIQVTRKPPPVPTLRHPPMKKMTSIVYKPSLDSNGATASFSLEDTDGRCPYFSSSSTGWLLSQTNLTSLPSPPPPAHLAPVKSKRSYDPFFPPILSIPPIMQIKKSDYHLPYHLNTDRTPTQSLYRSKSLRSLRSLRSLMSPLSSLDGSTTPRAVIKTTGLYSQVNTLDHFDEVSVANYILDTNLAQTSRIDPTKYHNSPIANSVSPNSSSGSLLEKQPTESIPSIPSTYSVNLIYSTPTPSTPSIPSLPSMPSMTSIPSLVETPDQTFSSTLIGSGDIPNADDSLVTQNSDVQSVPDTPLSPLSPSSNPTHSLHTKLHTTTEKDIHNPNGYDSIPITNSLEEREVGSVMVVESDGLFTTNTHSSDGLKRADITNQIDGTQTD